MKCKRRERSRSAPNQRVRRRELQKMQRRVADRCAVIAQQDDEVRLKPDTTDVYRCRRKGQSVQAGASSAVVITGSVRL